MSERPRRAVVTVGKCAWRPHEGAVVGVAKLFAGLLPGRWQARRLGDPASYVGGDVIVRSRRWKARAWG